ncbi:MAG TPA: helicase-related protein [Rhizomicrobium sp.]|jgi:ATP-dependent RNA helicase SUPV3L1/SUV3|nr:helicase-related protein [Rhizomicrobium sp.]
MQNRRGPDRTPSQIGRVTAVLGPTNTGKTHFAIERMLAHKSGMIGLPLRLLAREVYDKIVRMKGDRVCALITGEEKIVPPDARYHVCTVEAMPLDLPVSCLVIDEIQLSADPERGHVFTDRLLNARGEEETILLGADTMRVTVARFIPHAHFISRQRFSDLAYTGAKKLTRLPRRSAIVAFSAEDVYGIAELVRRQRGGAAVVLGALSPRTRNAQVQLYQSGEVDFLVATDAIGMGLNMDVDHVAFAAMDKFDGSIMRPLRPDEAGQIAGRAGRHMNDGTFGTTGEADALDEELVSRIEGHRYDPVRVLQWRNSSLDFRSTDTLLTSLDASPPARGLAKARPASDFNSLRALSSYEDVKALVHATAGVKRLWEVCQLPDFRKLSDEEHVRLVHTIFGFLMSDEGVLPEDWLARQIERLNITEGDVATLSGRLAQIRTWTYAANRPGWIRHAGEWQDKTRAIEDKLSDALHERLTQRFIDRRTSVLMKRLREDDLDDLVLDDSGGVIIGGQPIGKLEGFRFTADENAEGIHGRTLRAAALKALEGEFFARAQRLTTATDTEITLSEHGKLWWDGAIVGQLTAGPAPLDPLITVIADENLAKNLREDIATRLNKWLRDRITLRLAPLLSLRENIDAKSGTPDALPGVARGIAYQLCENLGTLDIAKVTIPGDPRPVARALRDYGVKLGHRSIYMPQLLRPDAASLLSLLRGVALKLERLPAPPQAGLTSFPADRNANREMLNAAGFRVVAGRAIRVDMLERLEDELEKGVAEGASADTVFPKVVSLLGTDRATLEAVLADLGWKTVEVKNDDAPATTVWRHRSARQQPPKRGPKPPPKPKHREHAPVKVNPNSPFASLAALKTGRR